jgi:DNA-directed RNA polymerase specialized sigma24 family protein
MKHPPFLSLWQRQYAEGRIGKKKFEALIFQYLLDNSGLFRVFEDEEQWADYLCWFYPRLSRSIDMYENKGASFEAYLATIIRWSARDYRRRERDHRITEYVCWKARAEEMAVHSPEPEYPEPERTASAAVNSLNPWHLLMLLLKSYRFVSDDFLERFSGAIGMDTQTLKQLIEELRKLRVEREEEIRKCREALHLQYYRCLAFEKRLAMSVPETSYHEKMKQYCERAWRRMANMKERLRGIRANATNRQVGKVLGIPRGTVASGLYALKTRWEACNGGTADYQAAEAPAADYPAAEEGTPGKGDPAGIPADVPAGGPAAGRAHVAKRKRGKAGKTRNGT